MTEKDIIKIKKIERQKYRVRGRVREKEENRNEKPRKIVKQRDKMRLQKETNKITVAK